MIKPIKVTHTEIIEALNRGATLVTANKRLAGVTRQIFEKANIDKGLEVWPTPKILPWSVWLQDLWEEAVVSGALVEQALLLTPQQELYIWKEKIAGSEGSPLLDINGTARQAQQAWQLMQAWQLNLNEATFGLNSDSSEFYKWATAFENDCQNNNWLSMAKLPAVMHHSAVKGLLSTPKELILSGFDELTPQQQSFISAIEESSCKVSWLQLAGLSGKAVRVACSDSRAEADLVARWARQCISNQPNASIGIVVPELQSKRNIIMQSLDKTLLPQSMKITESSESRPYNVSLGLPLTSYPIIETALQLTGLLLPTISLQDAGMILRSPFIRGWQEEGGTRALLDGQLRQNVGELNISLKTIRRHASKQDRHYTCPQLVKNIDACDKVIKKNHDKHTAAQWAEKIAALLKAFGWSAGRSLSSDEYQATEAWRDLLVSFATLDAITDTMDAAEVVSQLRSMAKARTFQPQSGNLPIQVLGVLEAEEMHFDYLWIMGLHDGIWPPAPHANPYLPITLQREAGLPHSSEDKELQVAQRSTQRLLNSATEVITSYPKRDGDNELRVSSLIANLDEFDQDALELSPAVSWAEEIYNSKNLGLLEVDPAPPLGGVAAKGGSSILKHQANCPFRAFAECRLGAKVPGDAGIGLNAMVKGQLIHTILENVWKTLETQEQLLKMEPPALKKLVHEITDAAVEKIAWQYPQTLIGRYRQLETERLCSRAIEWLDYEKTRPDFKVVAPEEKLVVEVVDGVEITVVIDRIDEQTKDGKKLVIDYKTGKVEPKQWFGDRPEDPQLPLYSMLAEGDIAAVVFAQVRANEMKFKGVAEADKLLPDVRSFESVRSIDIQTWNEVLSEWEKTLKRLAENFRDGDAAIDPKNEMKTCDSSYCKLKPLCRINELTQRDDVIAEMEQQ